jgi:uncharacterized YceG family protein
VSEFGRSSEERERARLEREARRSGEQFSPPPPARVPTMPPTWDGGGTEPKASAGLPAGRIALIVAGIIALVCLWFLVGLFQPFAGDGKGEGRVALTIPHGADVSAIGELLAGRDVVASARKFGWRASWSGRSADFKAGRYEFGKGMSYAAAIDLLADGPNAGTTVVTVPEGRSRWETAQQVERLGLKGDYMAASTASALIPLRRWGAPAGTDSLEGFLFPATYEFPAGTEVARLVRQQAAAFRKNLVGVDMSYAKRKNLTVFDVVTIASLIDREVSLASERRLVAAVIYNRLKAGIPLGIDATSRFETRNWTEPLTNAVLGKDTPYNTRINKGLPPGPIGSPGLAAINAAARPASSGYLYYVANPCKPGTHTFTKTYEEFQAAADRYNRAREQAGGKQPSGC